MEKHDKLILILLVITFLWIVASGKQPSITVMIGEPLPCDLLIPPAPEFSPDAYIMAKHKALTISPKVF